jgi:hypothetical protein
VTIVCLSRDGRVTAQRTALTGRIVICDERVTRPSSAGSRPVTARRASERLWEVVTLDDRLAVAARKEGFVVVEPGSSK